MILPLYRPTTSLMWFVMTDLRVFASPMDETQEGSWECQTGWVSDPGVETGGSWPTERMPANLLVMLRRVVDLNLVSTD